MKHFQKPLIELLVALALGTCEIARAASGAAGHLKNTDEWFRSDEAKRIAENILSWQSPEGGWPKNTNTTVPFTGDRAKLKGTFDNGATTDELRLLARVSEATKSTNYIAAFERGIAHILKSQYPNGGWPQFYPPPTDKYHRHITFNDGAMVRLMIFLREVATEKRYEFAEQNTREVAQRSFERGVDCILKCQIKVDGQLTAWCAQHDEVDFSPRPARTFELASLSGSESVGIVRLLMTVEPTPEIVRSVDAAIAWFESAKIPGIRIEQLADKNAPSGKDKVPVKDAGANPMWARFYEIGTNKPIFAGRDGVKKYALSEIEHERRNGYAWLGYWPETLIVKEYPAWKAKITKPEK